jgi:molybdopterin-binding protein
VVVNIGDADVGGPLITSSITNESVDRLGLEVGGSVYVVVKASDVMIGVD